MAIGEAAKVPHQVISEVLGYIDRATVGEIHGWVWNKHDPLSRRKINAYVDGSFVESFVACRFRQDLKDANIGDGFYSFELSLPRGKYKPGSTLRLVDAVTGTELFGSPTRLGADRGASVAGSSPEQARVAPQPAEPSATTNDYGGNVVNLAAKAPAGVPAPSAISGEIFWADEQSIVGWVADEGAPERRLRVQVLVDGRECGAALADERPIGGRAVEIGDGMHGFRINFRPEHLIAEQMKVEVIVEGGLAVLRPSAGVIGSAVQGGLDRCDDRLVRGWAINWNEPSRKAVVEIYLNGELIGEAEANRPRDDLKRLGLGDGACGFLFKFPKAIEMKLSQDVVVRALVAFTNVELAYSPWWVGRAVSLPASSVENKS
jgi:hypothetical protein